MASKSDANGIDRRTALKAISTGTAGLLLSGCQGSGSDENLGERVPPITHSWFADVSLAQGVERQAQVLKSNWEELGLDVELEGMPVTDAISATFDDDRIFHLLNTTLLGRPSRLDPHELINNFRADFAGANGLPNWSNFADCEFSEIAIQQSTASSLEEREKLVNEAYKMHNKHRTSIPTVEMPNPSVYRGDEVEIQRSGKYGYLIQNIPGFVATSPMSGDRLDVGVVDEIWGRLNFLSIAGKTALTVWNNFIYSPLLGYDENYEVMNVLVDNVQTKQETSVIRFTLKDEAVFHNGDPITAEDVKFSYSLIHNNAGENPTATTYPFDGSPEEAIEVVDQKTVEFSFSRSYPTFLTRDAQVWGIFPKSLWVDQGAREDPTGFTPENFVGSGPFELGNVQLDQFGVLEPADSHPVFNPGNNVVLHAYSGGNAQLQALKAGEIDIAARVGNGKISGLLDEIEDAEVVTGEKIHPINVYPQMSFGPTQFRAFNNALGMAIDRKQINAVTLDGGGNPFMKSIPISSAHPWFPGDEELEPFTEDPTGDIAGAKQELEDAGFEFDNDGNLHYPSDANIEPVWPKGETPSQDDFECIGELKN